jgi:hypothetical protein
MSLWSLPLAAFSSAASDDAGNAQETSHRADKFPSPSDPDFAVAASAVDFYKNGPSFLQRHFPLWLTVHAQRAIALVITAFALGGCSFATFPRVRMAHT